MAAWVTDECTEERSGIFDEQRYDYTQFCFNKRDLLASIVCRAFYMGLIIFAAAFIHKSRGKSLLHVPRRP